MLGRLGEYELLSELGRGGMGIVYTARHARLGRPVALKVLHAYAATDARSAARFAQEAQSLARLRHPNIVTVHEARLEGLNPYLAMELVEGESLSARLARSGPLPPREAVELVLGAAAGLAHAHAQGVLHRDLKPGNVLAGADGVPRLTDFGLARELSADRERLTRTGELLGTPAYMAPEQVNDAKAVDERADVYGLGATLYALLAGEAPFQGATPTNVIVKVMRDPPAPPSVHAPAVPTELDWIVLESLRKHPNLRYPSVDAFAADLRRWLVGEAIQAGSPARERSPWPVVAGLATVLGLAVGALWFALSAPPRGPEPALAPSSGAGQDERLPSVDAPPPEVAPPEQARKILTFDGLSHPRALITDVGGGWCSVLNGTKEELRGGAFFALNPGGGRRPLRGAGEFSGVTGLAGRLLVATGSGLYWTSPGAPAERVPATLSPPGETPAGAQGLVTASDAPRVAFVALFAKTQEVWVCRVEGDELVRLRRIPCAKGALLALSPDGEALLVTGALQGGDRRRDVSLWAVDGESAPLWSKKGLGAQQGIESIAFGPPAGDETPFAISADQFLFTGKLRGGRVQGELQSLVDTKALVPEFAHLAVIDGVAFGPRGKLYSAAPLSQFTGSKQLGELKVWERDSRGTWSLERSEELLFDPNHTQVTADRRWLLMGSEAHAAFAVPLPLPPTLERAD